MCSASLSVQPAFPFPFVSTRPDLGSGDNVAMEMALQLALR